MYLPAHALTPIPLTTLSLLMLLLVGCGGGGQKNDDVSTNESATIADDKDRNTDNTPAPDTRPNTFSFAPQSGVALNTALESTTITVGGIDTAAPISVTGGQYRIDTGSFTRAAGTVNNGQALTLQHTSSAEFGTTTTTTLTIGGVSADFNITTVADNVVPSSDLWVVSASHRDELAPLGADENISTRWNTGTRQVPGQSFDINLTQVATFKHVVLDSSNNPNDYPRGYDIYVSNDGMNWGSPRVSGAGNSAITSIDFPTAQTAQYIRIVQTSSDNYYYWSIDEVTIQNTAQRIDPTDDPAQPVVTGASQKTWQDWKAEIDSFMTTDTLYQAALKSHASSDMYFESFDLLFGLYRVWQATGDFNYLDKAFDLVEADIDGAVELDEFYEANPGPGGGYFRPSLPYKGWPMYNNYWADKQGRKWDDGFSFFFPPLEEFINDNDGKEYSYSYIAARDTTTPLATTPLSENIYARFMADMLRIIYKYPEVLSKTSGNGETYGSRSNSILSYLEIHIWEKWAEYESSPRHKEYYVYRENTHMASHLASIAISLYSITDENKYRDFIDEFLYDFGSNPGSPIDAGVGYIDQLHVDASGAYTYSSAWGEKPRSVGGEGNAQDISHLGPELMFFSQAIEEGITFDQEDMDRFLKTVINNIIIGDPATSMSVTYRIDDEQKPWWNKSQMTQGVYIMAQYHEDILRFLENNYNNKISDMAHGAYAARIFSGDKIPYPGR